MEGGITASGGGGDTPPVAVEADVFTGLLGPLVKSQHQLQPLSAGGETRQLLQRRHRLGARHHLWRKSAQTSGSLQKVNWVFYYRRGDGEGEVVFKGEDAQGQQRGRGAKAVQRREARWKQHVGHDQEFAVREHRGDGIQAAQQRDQGKQDTEKFTTAISLTRPQTRSSAPPLRGFDYAH